MKTTKPHPLDTAIESLKSQLEYWTIPLRTEPQASSLEAAIRVLEAAKRVDEARRAIERLNYTRTRFIHVINLLESLPEVEE